jgi:hypothetical protein
MNLHLVDFDAYEGPFVPQDFHQLAVGPGVEPLVEGFSVVQALPEAREVPDHDFSHASADALTKEVGDGLM